MSMPSPLLPLPFSHSSSEINSTRREREDEGLMGHIFGPAVMLVLWNLVVEVWMYSRLIPTIEGANIKAKPEDNPEVFKSKLPADVRWKIENYNHLTEQPTIFYAIIGVLAILGNTTSSQLNLAWAYVIIRVLHSLVHATVNFIPLRVALFILSSFVLLALTLHAAMLVF